MLCSSHRPVRSQKLLFALLLLLVPLILGGRSRTKSITFQEGVAGYAGTQELHLSIPANFTGNGHEESEFAVDPENRLWVWDVENTWGQGSVTATTAANRLGLGDDVGLLRFDNLFGTAAGQIPPGSTIVSATLSLWPDNQISDGDPANLHRVLVDWDESTTWQSFGALAGPDFGDDFAPTIDATTAPTVLGQELVIDVTDSVSAWSQAPSTNRGWVFLPFSAQDVITVSDSQIANVTSVTVDLDVQTPQRGELVVTLRHGDYVSVLLDRVERANCLSKSASAGDDLNVTIDQNAAQDIHFSGHANGLTGSWKPDAFCTDLPLCTGGGTGGLCGQAADGEWVLSVHDEWVAAGLESQLLSWGVTVSDGVTQETYSSSPALTVPKRQGGNKWSSWILSAESEEPAFRPSLTVRFRPPAAAPQGIEISPPSLELHVDAGLQSVTVTLPYANALGPVTVAVGSDEPLVADAVNSPLVFPAGGATSLPLEIAIGQVGSADLTTSNDAGLPEATLPVLVGADTITVSPAVSYRTVGDPGGSLSVTIPLGSNSTSAVDLSVSSSDPAVADLVGASGGSLAVTYPPGGANTQNVDLSLGVVPGEAIINATDDASALVAGAASVVLSSESPIQYDVNIPPYVQLGDAPLGALSDQFVIAWQTITRSVEGGIADRFEFEYRRVGDPLWIQVPLSAPIEHGSTSRLNHFAVVPGLDFAEQYEYRVVHFRNEIPLPGGTYQDTLTTRSTGDFRFTSFGNSGQGVPSQATIAARLATLGTDLHLLLGDFVYWIGEYHHYKPRITAMYGSEMSRVPFLPAIGNHDVTTDAGLPALAFFHVPENGPPALTPERSYSFDVGDVHFVSVDTVGGGGLSYLQTDVEPWLRNDLATSTKTWKIVYSHEVPLTLDPFGIDRQAIPAVRDYVLKPAVEEGADLFIGGAVHSFQRYLPITAVTTLDPFVEWAACEQGQGTTLIYTGTGSWTRVPSEPIPPTLDPPMVLYAPQLGIGVFDVSGNTLTATLVGSGGQTIDSVVLSKCLGPQDCVCPVCGDGVVEPPEECDDANTLDGDGCSSTCQLETP